MSRQVHLSFTGPGYYTRPDIIADVVRETKTQVILKHSELGQRPVAFSRANGFSQGTVRERGIGRVGYMLPFEETKRGLSK